LQGISVLSIVGLSIYGLIFAWLCWHLLCKMHDSDLPESATIVYAPLLAYANLLGTATFALQAIPIVSGLHEEMLNPDKLLKVVIVVHVAMWVFYSMFAVLGFVCFGDATESLVYLSAPEGSILRNGGSAAVATILVFSYMVQAAPIFKCVSAAFNHIGLAEKLGTHTITMMAVRYPVLALATVLALFLPNFELVLSLTGSTLSVLLSFVFPALTYLKLSSSDEWLSRCVCCVLLLVGVLAACLSFTLL